MPHIYVLSKEQCDHIGASEADVTNQEVTPSRKMLCVLLGPTALKREKIFIYFNISGTKQVKQLQCLTAAQIYLG